MLPPPAVPISDVSQKGKRSDEVGGVISNAARSLPVISKEGFPKCFQRWQNCAGARKEHFQGGLVTKQPFDIRQPTDLRDKASQQLCIFECVSYSYGNKRSKGQYSLNFILEAEMK